MNSNAIKRRSDISRLSKTNYNSSSALGFVLIAVGCAVSQPALAQAESDTAAEPEIASPQNSVGDGSGDIVVTANKREQSLRDVGMSISAIGGDDLRAQGITDVKDLVRVVPGSPSPSARRARRSIRSAASAIMRNL